MSTYKFDTDDRGHARYFHGRQGVLAGFTRVLRRAINKDFKGNGTIFLIQGTPGAGKTALLYRFKDLVAAGGDEVGSKKWRVLRIGKTHSTIPQYS